MEVSYSFERVSDFVGDERSQSGESEGDRSSQAATTSCNFRRQ